MSWIIKENVWAEFKRKYIIWIIKENVQAEL